MLLRVIKNKAIFHFFLDWGDEDDNINVRETNLDSNPW